jgi:undecaprenyl-diphosphatase
MQQFDRAIFKWINGGSSAYEGGMRFFSEGLDQLWMKILLLLVLIALIAAGKDTRKGAVCALASFPLADGLTNVLKHLIPLPRPCNDPTLSEIVVRIGKSASAGTASAHSANMMAVAICFLIALRGWGVPWLILALLVAISRIYNGMHYPYQVLLGWVCGAFAAVLVNYIWQLIEKKRSSNKTSVNEPGLDVKSQPVELKS